MSSDEHTPNTEEVLKVWKYYQAPKGLKLLRKTLEFYRWLDEERRAIAERAWDEGVMAKSNSSSIFDSDVLATNPYRHLNVPTDLTGTSDMQNLGPILDTTTLTSQIGSALAAKQDAWLQGICDSLNITPEQLAAKYELEEFPGPMTVGGGKMTVSKVVRLVPKKPTDTEGTK